MKDTETIEKMAEEIKKSVGKRAQSFRKRAGFSSADLAAKAMKISPTALYELERGHSWISAEMAIRMRTAYGLSEISALLTDNVVKIQPTVEEAWEIVGKFLNEYRVKPITKTSPLLETASNLLSEVAEEDLPGIIASLKLTVGGSKAKRNSGLDQAQPIQKRKTSQ